MDDDRAGRAAATSFLELVSPATIIGHGLAFEELVFAGVAWIIDQHHDGLARHIKALIIVPAIFWCDDTIANKNQFRARPCGFRAILFLGPDDGVFFQSHRKIFPRCAAGEGQSRSVFVERLLDHAHGLEPGAVFARWLQSNTFHFRGNPVCGLLAFFACRAAAFKGVIRKRGNALTQIVGPNGSGCAFWQRHQQLRAVTCIRFHGRG